MEEQKEAAKVPGLEPGEEGRGWSEFSGGSFSSQVKRELLAQLQAEEGEARQGGDQERLADFGRGHLLALLAGAQLSRRKFVCQLAQDEVMLYFCQGLKSHFGLEVETRTYRSYSRLQLDSGPALERLLGLFRSELNFALPKAEGFGTAVDELSLSGLRLQLRFIFLAVGSVSNPQRSYHAQFGLKRQAFANYLLRLLERLELRASEISCYGSVMLYFKEAERISQLLAQMSTSLAYLAFEERRVEKEVKNTINRIVNCDSANARRTAQSSARLCELLRRYQAQPSYQDLDDQLKAAAQLRLDYPGLSLTELAAQSSPPVSKSGIFHRLRQVEQRALEALGSLSERGAPASRSRRRKDSGHTGQQKK